MPVLILSAKADKSLMGLDKILDDKLVTPLGRVKGVGTISVSGARRGKSTSIATLTNWKPMA